MRANGGGRILCSTSSSVKAALNDLILSNTFRMGVVGLAKTLSQELGPDNILVNIIGPGRVGTARIDQLDQIRAQKEGLSVEELQHKMCIRDSDQALEGKIRLRKTLDRGI